MLSSCHPGRSSAPTGRSSVLRVLDLPHPTRQTRVRILLTQIYHQSYPTKLILPPPGPLSPRPHLVAIIAKEALLNQFNDLCSSPTLTAVHSFKHIKTVKQAKDGGVFIRFTYVPLPESEGGKDKALEDIEKAFEDEATKAGGLKTWNWMGQGKVWRVLGRPWHEVSRVERKRARGRRGRR